MPRAARSTVRITLSGDPERTVAIPIVVAANQGGATTADYSSLPASVTFNSGETSKSFTFSATDDTVDDDGESVKLTFGALPSRVSQGARNETTVNIADDDDPEVTVAFVQDVYRVVEGRTVTVRITLSADPERTVAIPLSKTEQNGASSADYSGVPGERHLQRRRDVEDVRLRGHGRHVLRHRGEREADLRYAARPSVAGNAG